MRSLILLIIILASSLAFGQFNAAREFPNYFLPAEWRHSAPENIPHSVVEPSKLQLEKAMASVFRRLIVPLESADGKISSIRYFPRIQDEVQKIDPEAKVMASGGVVRSAISYLYAEMMKGLEKNPAESPEQVLQKIINSKQDLPSLEVRGVGSDFDILIRSKPQTARDLISKVLEVTNGAETRHGLDMKDGAAKRSLFTIGDAKEYDKQISRSTKQGGADLDFLAFDVEAGRFIEPPGFEGIVERLIRGIYRYLPPFSANDVEDSHKQTIRGLRGLLELPFLSIENDAVIKKEVTDLKKTVDNRGHLSLKAIEQYDKMVRNARFSGANNRFYRAAAGSLEAQFLELSKLVGKQNNRVLLPEFVDRVPLNWKSELLPEFPQEYLLSYDTFSQKFAKDGTIYHGTPNIENGLAIMRGGLFISKSEQGLAIYGRGGYSSPDLAVAQSYAGSGGIVFQLKVKNHKNLRIVNWANLQNSPFIKALKTDGRDVFEILARKYGIDIIIHHHVLIQNSEAIETPKNILFDIARASYLVAANPENRTEERRSNFLRYLEIRTYLAGLGYSSRDSRREITQIANSVAEAISKNGISQNLKPFELIEFIRIVQSQGYEIKNKQLIKDVLFNSYRKSSNPEFLAKASEHIADYEKTYTDMPVDFRNGLSQPFEFRANIVRDLHHLIIGSEPIRDFNLLKEYLTLTPLDPKLVPAILERSLEIEAYQLEYFLIMLMEKTPHKLDTAKQILNFTESRMGNSDRGQLAMAIASTPRISRALADSIRLMPNPEKSRFSSFLLGVCQMADGRWAPNLADVLGSDVANRDVLKVMMAVAASNTIKFGDKVSMVSYELMHSPEFVNDSIFMNELWNQFQKMKFQYLPKGPTIEFAMAFSFVPSIVKDPVKRKLIESLLSKEPEPTRKEAYIKIVDTVAKGSWDHLNSFVENKSYAGLPHMHHWGPLFVNAVNKTTSFNTKPLPDSIQNHIWVTNWLLSQTHFDQAKHNLLKTKIKMGPYNAQEFVDYAFHTSLHSHDPEMVQKMGEFLREKKATTDFYEVIAGWAMRENLTRGQVALINELQPALVDWALRFVTDSFYFIPPGPPNRDKDKVERAFYVLNFLASPKQIKAAIKTRYPYSESQLLFLRQASQKNLTARPPEKPNARDAVLWQQMTKETETRNSNLIKRYQSTLREIKIGPSPRRPMCRNLF